MPGSANGTKAITGCATASLMALGATLLLAIVLLSALISNLSGSGSDGAPCGTAVTLPAADQSTVVPSGSPAGSATPGCLPPSGIEAAVVQFAEQMANALYVNPSCHGIISYPDCYYTWYDSQFPQAVIRYGEQVCPGCYAWANGTYQCVSFVRGAYSQAYPMQWTANAFDLWATYQGKPGWTEVPAAAAPPGQRGMPQPGDVMVFKDASVGHVAIIVTVVPPQQNRAGSVTFANANSVSPYTTMPLLPDLTVDSSSWPGYTVWGYIRPSAKSSTVALETLTLHPSIQFWICERRRSTL